jgi:hypothetical protein
MPVVDILRTQKAGLLIRLAEQKRALTESEKSVAKLMSDRETAESIVSGLRQTWNMLDSNLALFVQRLESKGAVNLDVTGKVALAELVKFFRSHQSEVRVNEAQATSILHIQIFLCLLFFV